MQQPARYRFNSPPGWPVPPPGWVPPEGWQSDPRWPQPPAGWAFWLPVEPSTATPPPATAEPVVSWTPRHAVKDDGPGGLFGKRKALEDENARLRTTLDRLGALDAVRMETEIVRLCDELAVITARVATAQGELEAARRGVVETEEIALLQEAGVYQYAHPLGSAVGYKDLLAAVKSDTKGLIRDGMAVLATVSWEVNGSSSAGRKMVGDFSKLLLRAYNA
jgi:hypothetical protein